MDLMRCVMQLFPNAVYERDFTLIDYSDGNGARIKTWMLPDPKPTQDQLQQAWIQIYKSDKITELSIECNQNILAGFHSTTMNSFFAFGDYDQINFTQQMLLMVQDTTITSTSWKTEDNGIINITRDQFFAVIKEAEEFKRNNIGKYWTKKSLINSRTKTLDDVNFFVWNDTTKPSLPTNLVQSASTTSSVTVTWNMGTELDLVGYNIYVNGNLDNTTGLISTNTYTANNLEADNGFEIKLIAVDADNNQSDPAFVTARTDAVPTTTTTP